MNLTSPFGRAPAAVISAALFLCAFHAGAATLEVGPGKAFARPEEAVAKAQAGDTIRIHPPADDQPYRQVKLKVRTARLTIQGVPGPKDKRVRFEGTGFDYSGAGPVPRAIAQFDPGADGCVLENFELFGARNSSHNGAGVRVNQANRVTVRNCEIHHNDMGVMSNGDLAARSGAEQRLEGCLIRENGSEQDPGYNHNLYLGGTSVTVSACEIHGAVTGHNLKSRAHFNWIEYCHLHDSANRELDLVDQKGNTDAPDSHSVLLGNIIVKKAKMNGNKTVIHFGQDGKNDHRGTLFLVHNTIVTPYQSPVADLSAPGAEVQFVNNLVWDGGTGGDRVLINARDGARADRAGGRGNWLAAGFRLPAGWDAQQNYAARKGEAPPFADAARGDWKLKAPALRLTGAGLPLEQAGLPPPPGAAGLQPPVLRQYRAPLQTEPRQNQKQPDCGACELGAAKGG